EVFRLDAARIRDLARHPAGHFLPAAAAALPGWADDWAAALTTAASVRTASPPPGGYAVVPKYVLDFIGFGDIGASGRAVTLFSSAAALAEAVERHGIDAVIAGLLTEPAL